MAFSVLVVDDYEPFRRVVRSILQLRHDLQVVDEASDGLDAVQKAKELRPDLILLDVALPKLNGIQAARRLRDIVPHAKILFVSTESSSDIVMEAFNVGGVGYIHKLHTTSDLLPAIEKILRGERFASSSLRAFEVRGTRDEYDCRPDAPLTPPASFMHEVAFYADDAALVDDFTRFIETNLNSGHAVIVAVTESHGRSILQNLQRDGLDIAGSIQQGCYVPLDASKTLSKFMVNDWPDSARLAKLLEELVERTAKLPNGKRPRVSTCGELAPTLWVEGKMRAAIQVEHLWDEITRTLDIDTLCGYLSGSFHDDTEAQGFETICAEHAVFSFR